MRLLILPFFIWMTLTSFAAAEDSLAWVDQQIAAIKPKRAGISDTKISAITSPIRYRKVDEEETKESSDGTKSKPIVAHTELAAPPKPLRVTAIMNSSALIDGQWLKVNSSIRGYKVRRINSDNVLLQNSSKKLKLFIKEKNDKIKIQIN